MQQVTSWADLEGKKVGLWGYGVEGKATQELIGDSVAELIIVDDGLAQESDKILTFAEAKDKLESCDVVIKSPGISRYDEQFLELSQKTTIVGATGLWLNGVDRDKVICVTGTKGKSTTSALCAEILSSLGHDVCLAGNIGEPAWASPADQEWDYWVVETSSFQVMDIQLGPKVVALTSLHSDHLPWHKEPEQYFSDKLGITKREGVERLVFNSDDENLAIRPEVTGFAGVSRATSMQDIVSIPQEEMSLRGSHNRSNAALAIAAVEALTGEVNLVNNPVVTGAITDFEGLAHRFQTVASAAGVDFINDSLSTNPLPTMAALTALEGETVALIIGGFDRGVDQSDLIDFLATRGEEIKLACIPDTGKDIAAQLLERDIDATVIEYPDLETATTGCFGWLSSAGGGVVLLSPAAASFNAFSNYRERGDRFTQVALALVAKLN